jgi:hypothetical protein
MKYTKSNIHEWPSVKSIGENIGLQIDRKILMIAGGRRCGKSITLEYLKAKSNEK